MFIQSIYVFINHDEIISNQINFIFFCCLKKENESAFPSIKNLANLVDTYECGSSLIGVANLFLDSLFIDNHILFEYDVPIINQQGEISGRLKLKLQRLDSNESCVEDHEELDEDEDKSQDEVFNRRLLKFKLFIVEAYDLPIRLNNAVHCQYQFWIQNRTYSAKSLPPGESLDEQRITKFNYENEFCIEISEELIEYCLDGALSIEVLGQYCEEPTNADSLFKTASPKKYAEAMEKYNKMAKEQSLIESWNEVSKAVEMHVQIHELSADGSWRPVPIKQNAHTNKTGGIYQLKQGQSRQLSVRVNQTKAHSIMWYNGVLFNLELHKIDKISVGSVLGKETSSNQPLDSYQDSDLNRLKEKCKEILETRKKYLYLQLQSVGEVKEQTEDERDRYESLCKQLVDLNEDQAALDAPEDNSGLPGSTIEWEPANGMEKHVPIVFLDMDNEPTHSDPHDLNMSEDFYEDDLESHSSSRTTWNEKRGHDCALKFENKESRFSDLKLLRWNDSTLTELTTNDDLQSKEENITNDFAKVGGEYLRFELIWL